LDVEHPFRDLVWVDEFLARTAMQAHHETTGDGDELDLPLIAGGLGDGKAR
jgi:hypothetical protein